MPPPEDSQLQPLTLRLPPAVIAQLEQFSEGSTRSATARTFLEFGLQQLTQPGALESLEAHHLLSQLEQLNARWSAGRCTSGARWYEALPDPEQVAALQLPAVIASPDVVKLVDAKGQSLAVGFGADAEMVATTEVGKAHRAEVVIGQIVTLAGEMGAALVELANGPMLRRHFTRSGFILRRSESGDVRLSCPAGPSMYVPPLLLWVWVAELNGAIARSLAGSVAVRQALEQQLQAGNAALVDP